MSAAARGLVLDGGRAIPAARVAVPSRKFSLSRELPIYEERCSCLSLLSVSPGRARKEGPHRMFATISGTDRQQFRIFATFILRPWTTRRERTAGRQIGHRRRRARNLPQALARFIGAGNAADQALR